MALAGILGPGAADHRVWRTSAVRASEKCRSILPRFAQPDKTKTWIRVYISVGNLLWGPATPPALQAGWRPPNPVRCSLGAAVRGLSGGTASPEAAWQSPLSMGEGQSMTLLDSARRGSSPFRFGFKSYVGSGLSVAIAAWTPPRQSPRPAKQRWRL